MKLAQHLLEYASEIEITKHADDSVTYKWQGSSDWCGLSEELVSLAHLPFEAGKIGATETVGPFHLYVFYYDHLRRVYYAQLLNADEFSVSLAYYNGNQHSTT